MRKPGTHAVEAMFRALNQRTHDVLARGETISGVAVFKDGDIAPASMLLEAAGDVAPQGLVWLELAVRPDQTCELPQGVEFELRAGRQALGHGRIAGTSRRDQLIIAITRCRHLDEARTNPAHPCACVVRTQKRAAAKCHVPEPWSGHIDSAPILFVGSNPSISENEDFPTSSWGEAKTVDFFQGRFDDGGPVTPKEFNGVRYWTAVRARAKELLGRDAAPGKDFALTEVVHCKSLKEEGVGTALPTCTREWLDEVMAQSVACIVVLLGRRAKDACAKRWGIDASKSVHFDVAIAGHSRAVVILPHPNARGPRKLCHHVNEEERRCLRGILSRCTVRHAPRGRGVGTNGGRNRNQPPPRVTGSAGAGTK